MTSTKKPTFLWEERMVGGILNKFISPETPQISPVFTDQPEMYGDSIVLPLIRRQHQATPNHCVEEHL